MSEVEVNIIGAGQSGLAAVRALQDHGICPVVLEAGSEPVGSWPRYYDSLALFSPQATAACRGWAFPAIRVATRTATRSSASCAATPPTPALTSASARR